MKPTAEMVERARSTCDEFVHWAYTDEMQCAIAQALADEHERAMERAAKVLSHRATAMREQAATWLAMGEDQKWAAVKQYDLAEEVQKCAAAIRAAAKGE